MYSHFTSLVDRLTLEDMEVLNVLAKQESISRFSAKTKKEIIKETNLGESLLRKTIIRLEAMNFINIVLGNREHLLYVNEYGQEAIQHIYERSNV